MTFLNFLSIIAIFTFSFLHGLEGAQKNEPTVSIFPAPPELLALGSAEHIVYFENFPKSKLFRVSFARKFQKNPDTYKNSNRLKIEKDWIEVDERTKVKFYALSSTGFAEGERIKYQFRDLAGKLIAETSYVPKPIRHKSDQGTFYLNIELESFEPTLYSYTLEGIKDGEKLNVKSLSGSETINNDEIYHSKSIHGYMPGIVGKSGGKSFLEITRESGDKVSIDLFWGKQLLREIKKQCK
jgi:hypothetical protein